MTKTKNGKMYGLLLTTISRLIELFNSCAINGDNLKKKAKKIASKQRKSIFKTGGGPAEVLEVSQSDEKVLEVIKEQIKPIENPFDSDKLADVKSPNEKKTHLLSPQRNRAMR